MILLQLHNAAISDPPAKDTSSFRVYNMHRRDSLDHQQHSRAFFLPSDEQKKKQPLKKKKPLHTRFKPHDTFFLWINFFYLFYFLLFLRCVLLLLYAASERERVRFGYFGLRSGECMKKKKKAAARERALGSGIYGEAVCVCVCALSRRRAHEG